MPGAWGQKPSDAIRAPPPPSSSSSSQPHQPPPPQARPGRGGNSSNNKGRSGGGRSGGSRGTGPHGTTGTGGRGGTRTTTTTTSGRGTAAPPSKVSSKQPSTTTTATGGHQTSQTITTHVKLCTPGSGETQDQRNVVRYTVETCLQLRHLYLVPSLTNFTAPPDVHWLAEDRIAIITSRAPRKTGDVSSRPHPRRSVGKETAPPLEDCKPLLVNDDTRWKSKVFDGTSNANEETKTEESNEDILKRALLILNKLSLTTFEKLSDAFIETGIGRSTECLTGAIALILEKAQAEPHFSNMYAMLCLKLSKTEFGGNKKIFKKLLLTHCQKEFEEDFSSKMAHAVENTKDPEEQAYMAALIKKKYLGHMRFIGELYKGDMIKIDIMLWCLTTLLDDVSEEEKVECFCKLMSTIGFSLEQQSAALLQVGKGKPALDLETCWTTVHDMAASTQVSPRMKFMLLDLIEMRDNGWVTRRKELTAKTIDQIHQEVAKEEANAARRSSSKRSLMNQRSGSLKPIVDDDGFVHVVPRAASYSNLSRSVSETATTPMPPKHSLGRSQSFSVAPKNPAPPPKPSKAFLGVKDIEAKTRNVLKEYFVSGEKDDAIVSINELVGAGHNGSIDRGAKVIETGCLLVMEMKEENVKKMMALFNQCLNDGKLEKTSLAKGLNDPLEFLNDIEIDAPFARAHLAMIVAEFITTNALTFDFLLSGPEYFRSSGKPAYFAAMVLKRAVGEVTDADIVVVEQLMSEKEKEGYATAKDFVASI